MKRVLVWAMAALVSSAALIAAPKFTTVWKTPAAREVSFAGKKVAALVITQDDSLRVSGEEALARELTGRGLQGIATYRIVPREELTVAEKARSWFERSGVEGVVALRPVSTEKRTTYTSGTWANPNYGTLWGYYGYGWTALYMPGSASRDTFVVVETTIYSVPRNTLLWAGVSETTSTQRSARSQWLARSARKAKTASRPAGTRPSAAIGSSREGIRGCSHPSRARMRLRARAAGDRTASPSS